MQTPDTSQQPRYGLSVKVPTSVSSIGPYRTSHLNVASIQQSACRLDQDTKIEAGCRQGKSGTHCGVMFQRRESIVECQTSVRYTSKGAAQFLYIHAEDIAGVLRDCEQFIGGQRTQAGISLQRSFDVRAVHVAAADGLSCC
jgi:hypothetical protein